MKNIRNSISFLLSLAVLPLAGQVPKQVVVEHFTNTRCSICAAQNPSFNAILAQHPEVMRISYHPTSPYVNCQLAQHNVAENDARTHFYNLYGSTPRLAINGGPISNDPNPYINPNLYDSYAGQSSAFRLNIQQQKEADTIRLRLVLTTEGTPPTGDLRLYAAAAEDTIFYTSPNGETQHHNVFRKTFFGADGLVFNPPAQGDSLVWTAAIARHPAWNFNRIFAYALVQQVSNKALVQSDFRKPGESEFLTSRRLVQSKPATQVWVDHRVIRMAGSDPVPDRLELMDLSGRKITSSPGQTLALPSGIQGIFLVQLWRNNQVEVHKIWVREN